MAFTAPLHRANSASPTLAQDHEASSHPKVHKSSATGEGIYSGTATSTRERNNGDDGEEFDEEEGAGDAEGGSTRIPLSGAVTAVQTMAIVGKLRVLHDDLGELDSGYASMYQQRRKLTVANDDYEDLNNNNLSYVRRMCAAITTTPAHMDDEQSKQAEVLAKKLKTFGEDADQYLAGKSERYDAIELSII